MYQSPEHTSRTTAGSLLDVQGRGAALAAMVFNY